MSNYDLSQFNSFLQKATDAVTCNSECQRNRTIDKLKQKFINAQTNVASASNQFQVAQKIFGLIHNHNFDLYELVLISYFFQFQ